ncbi:MAG: methyltransferase domain-containing protein [Candidatus Nanohaloarchaea archaeon]
MTYIYLLAGENLELAEAELNGFLRSQGIEEKPERDGRLGFTASHPGMLKRLALTHEVAEKIDVENFRPEGRYAVRAENLTGGEIDKEEIEERLGEKLSTSGNNVDLENPETLVKAFVTPERTFYGEMVQNIDRGLFNERSNEKRPFSSPVSLDPVLARVLVNLSEVPAGGKVLDPFCGTGGILIEAGLCGIGVKGLDFQEEMVAGTEENLEKYGILNYDIRQGDILDAEEEFESFDAVISDLPYGKASKKEGRPVEKFLEFIEKRKAVFMYNEASVGDYEADFEVFVHRNLTRYIYVLDQ